MDVSKYSPAAKIALPAELRLTSCVRERTERRHPVTEIRIAGQGGLCGESVIAAVEANPTYHIRSSTS